MTLCIIFFFFTTLSQLPAGASESDAKNNGIFASLVGDVGAMDSLIVARVLDDEPGKKWFFDADCDGKTDTMYFVDNDVRHTSRRQPLLVKVVDEDGDMEAMHDGDMDSDLWIADWYGDGSIDRIVDHADLDGDNDIDEQYLYQWTESPSLLSRIPDFAEKRAYCVTWAKDYGDDNRLWYHTNYEYGQTITQWLTDFNGDEMFVFMFFFDPEKKTLTPAWESAFSFYDLDGDACSEEVVRFSGLGMHAKDLRYSMDIDNDSGGTVRHDFDLSLTAIGSLDYDPSSCRTVTIRHLTTEPIMRWEDMRLVAKQASWEKILLTWDENDNNIDPREGQKHNERWEGVLNHVSDDMPAVGGPSGGPYNKRNEIDKDSSGKMQMYASAYDRRLHLFGAEKGWIDVDYNYDDIPDMTIRMEDRDGDGFFDVWLYDCDGNGDFERTVTVSDDTCPLLPFDYNTLHEAFIPLLKEAIDMNERIIPVLRTTLHILEDIENIDEIDEYFENKLISFDPEFGIGDKIVKSPEGKRYYGDIIRERYWKRFGTLAADRSLMYNDIIINYDRGDYKNVTAALEKRFSPSR